MRFAVGCVAVSMLLLGVPRSAGADPLTIRLDRYVSVGAAVAILGADVERENQQSGADTLFSTVTATSGPNSATGTQSLSSTLSSDSRQFSASGRTSAIAESPFSGDGTNAGAGGDTYVTWDFRLDQPYLFDFDTALTPSADDVSVIFRTSLSAMHGSRFDSIFSHESVNAGGGTITDHGRLEAGLYSFFFQTSAGVFTFEGSKAGTINLNFKLDLTPASPVPEPGTMSLLGAGLCGAVAGIRTRRRGDVLNPSPQMS